MWSIPDCVECIRDNINKQIRLINKVDLLLEQCDYDGLLNAVENSLHSASELYLNNRRLVLSVHETCPSLPRLFYSTDSEDLGIHVDALEEFDFPVYRISLPLFIPNKRSKAIRYKSALTDAVFSAVRQFASANDIHPFEKATVFFVSYYQGRINGIIDNDNKESTVILNGLNCFLLRDDRPTSCNTVYYEKQISESGAKTEIYVVDSKHDLVVFSMIKEK